MMEPTHFRAADLYSRLFLIPASVTGALGRRGMGFLLGGLSAPKWSCGLLSGLLLLGICDWPGLDRGPATLGGIPRPPGLLVGLAPALGALDALESESGFVARVGFWFEGLRLGTDEYIARSWIALYICDRFRCSIPAERRLSDGKERSIGVVDILPALSVVAQVR